MFYMLFADFSSFLEVSLISNTWRLLKFDFSKFLWLHSIIQALEGLVLTVSTHLEIIFYNFLRDIISAKTPAPR